MKSLLKKLIFLIVALQFSVTSFGQFTESFEVGNTLATAPVGWTQESSAGSETWLASNNAQVLIPHTGAWYAALANGGNQDYMFKSVTLTGGTAYRLSFYARKQGAAGTSKIGAYYGTTASSSTMSHEIVPDSPLSEGSVSEPYQFFENNFTPATSGTYFIGIFGMTGFGDYGISIDDIVLELAPPPCIITFSVVNPVGGTLIAKVDGSTIVSPATIQTGKNVEFTATANEGYQFKQWKLNGSPVDGNIIQPWTYTLTNATVSAEVTAEFEVIPYTVTFATTNSYGTLTATVDGMPITSPAIVLYGKSVMFTAVPDEHYRVSGWTFNGNFTAANWNTNDIINITTDNNVTVTFEEIPLLVVTFQPANNSPGDLTASVDGTEITAPSTVESGKTVNFVATPDQGYRVASWIVNDDIIIGNTNTTYDLLLESGNYVVMVNFEPFDITSFGNFTINGYTPFIDIINHTVKVTVPFNTNLTNLIATFTLAEGASAYIGDVLQISGVTANDFTTPKVYTITHAKSTENWTVSTPFGNVTTIDKVVNQTNIYPNPSSNVFNVEGKGIKNIKVTDITGKIVFETLVNTESTQIDLSNCESGIYFVQMQLENTIVNSKIVKK